MTRAELKELLDLQGEIKIDEMRLKKLIAMKSNFSTPEMLAGIHDIEDAINRKKLHYIDTYAKLNAYIENIPDSYTRQIIKMRYILGYSWTAVAYHMGGNNTANGVRSTAQRYIDKN